MTKILLLSTNAKGYVLQESVITSDQRERGDLPSLWDHFWRLPRRFCLRQGFGRQAAPRNDKGILGYGRLILSFLCLAITSPLSASPQHDFKTTHLVIPAKAGIQGHSGSRIARFSKVPPIRLTQENLTSGMTSGVLQDFETWKKLYEADASFQEITAFIKTHPDWPSQKTLQKKAEKAISDSQTDRQIIKWFRKFPPLTSEGAFHYAKALLNQGKTQQATEIIKKSWHEMEFTTPFLKVFRTTFQAFLTSADDEKRVNALLYKEERHAAHDMMSFLNAAQKKKAQARLALLDFHSHSEKPMEGLIYDQIKYYRRLKNYDEALLLLTSAHKDESEFAEAWWTERNLLTRYLLENKQYQQATTVIKGHRLKMGESYVHAEWMLGWLYLRFLGQAEAAYEKFKKVYALVKSPQSQSRFAFWAGEAAKKLHQSKEAQAWYQKASKHRGTYYGQLAISRLRSIYKKNLPIFSFAKKPSTSDADFKRFQKRPLVMVLRSLSKHDRDKYMFFFLFKLSELIKDEEEQQLLIQLAGQLGGAHAITEMSREISKKNYILREEAYPILAPAQIHLIGKIAGKRPLFCCLACAIIRQESRFNSKAESYAGAMGIMQLMHATAVEQMKRLHLYGLTVPKRASLLNPEKNLTLGAALLDQLIAEFDGNIVLVSAAYNAGSGNVRKWLKMFGDPRETKISWIDWVELLPYVQTRDYIHRVLENFMVYQYRLPQTKRATHDLGEALTIPLSTHRA